MGWCPKAKFLILYETLAFSVRAPSFYTLIVVRIIKIYSTWDYQN